MSDDDKVRKYIERADCFVMPRGGGCKSNEVLGIAQMLQTEALLTRLEKLEETIAYEVKVSQY